MAFVRKIKRLFYKPFSTHFLIRNADLFSDIQNKNRLSLTHVKDWIDADAMQKSCFRYGVPAHIEKNINLPFSNTPTYSDYICYSSTFLESPIKYLEIGVSVGKNFFQISNFLKNSDLTGFEIEDINPPLKKNFSEKGTQRWQNLPNSIKKTEASYTQYDFLPNNNTIQYLCADVFDEKSWARLQGQKFNLIFSDAFHDAKALFFEYEMIEKYDLLADKFIFFWDDCHFDMEDAFVSIASKMKQKYGLNKENIYLFKVNGWVGDNEPPHPVGLITNIKFQ